MKLDHAGKVVSNTASITAINALRRTVCATLGRTQGQGTVLNDGTNTQVLTYSVHKTGKAGFGNIQIGVANFRILGSSPYGETPNGGDVTTSVQLELADGTVIPCTFNGASSITLSAGSGVVFTDPLNVYIPPNTNFNVKKWDRVSATNITLGSSQIIQITNRQVARKGADLSALWATPGYPSTGTSSAPIPPVAIIGSPDSDVISFLYIGDSIMDGAGDTTGLTPDGETGYFGRGSVNVNGYNIPHIKATRGGETMKHFVHTLTGSRRRDLFRYATDFLCGFATNDMVNSQGNTLADLQSYATGIWAYAKRSGVRRVGHVTVLPRVTFAGEVQTPAAGFEPNGTSLRDTFNAWLFTQVGKGLLDYVCDFRELVEDVKGNPGYWKNGSADTGDGLHLNEASTTRIALNYINPLLARLDSELPINR
ncbi:MAG TPA: SGNH/GDSL hydrolase family protein [Cellvibrio sp.]|nr:SGNH/GDSL hydrolase family protein [Cellvibrio sp.]